MAENLNVLSRVRITICAGCRIKKDAYVCFGIEFTSNKITGNSKVLNRKNNQLIIYKLLKDMLVRTKQCVREFIIKSFYPYRDLKV